VRKAERNAIYEAIVASDFDPRKFVLDQPDRSGLVLTHEPSGFSLSFRELFGDWSVSYGTSEDNVRATAEAREEFPVYVRKWLQLLRDDLETPDLWAELQTEQVRLEGEPGPSVENTPFTPDELAEIVRELQAVAERAAQHDLTSAERKALESRLQYLEEAAGRLGRIDWRNALCGVMLTLVVTAALPPEPAHEILMLLLRTLGRFFGHEDVVPGLPSG
jgi:hypothetical protein